MSSRYSVLLSGSPQPSAQQSQEAKSPTEIVVKPPAQHDTLAAEIAARAAQPSSNDSMTARQLDSTVASPMDSLLSRHQDSLPSGQHDGMTAYSLHTFLNEKATAKTTIRLPEKLVQYLEDTLYRIKREQNVKLSMKSIIIVALTLFCEEFEQQGTDSPLYKKLLEAFH